MDEKKIEEILKHYTKEQQTIKAIEEFGEISSELARILNKQGDMKNLKSECADSFIMLMQIMILYGIDPEELDREIKFKLDRQLIRIQAQKQAAVDCGWKGATDGRD